MTVKAEWVCKYFSPAGGSNQPWIGLSNPDGRGTKKTREAEQEITNQLLKSDLDVSKELKKGNF